MSAIKEEHWGTTPDLEAWFDNHDLDVDGQIKRQMWPIVRYTFQKLCQAFVLNNDRELTQDEEEALLHRIFVQTSYIELEDVVPAIGSNL